MIHPRSMVGCGLRAGWCCSRFLPLPHFFLSRNTGRMSLAHSRMSCSSCAPCCTCSCMAGTAMNTPTTRHISLGRHKEVRNAHGYPSLWPLVPCRHQLGSLSHLCLQFHAPAQCPRLAFVWRVRGLPGGAVYGNVRLSADHLPARRLAAAWHVLYEAQRQHTLAVTGPYAHIRHPQYGGFILIMLGFLVQWPTLITLLMFPMLVTMYVRLAQREEREVLTAFGETYARYAANTPAFVPRLGRQVRREA